MNNMQILNFHERWCKGDACVAPTWATIFIFFIFIFIEPSFSQSNQSAQSGKKWDLSGYSKEIRARFREAETASRNQKWEEARQLYERLAQEFPQIPNAHLGAGISAEILADYPQAIAAFHKAIELIPNEPFLQGKLADAYRKNQQLDEAEKWYKNAVESATTIRGVGGVGGAPLASWYMGLGLIETFRGNHEKGRQYYIASVLIDPNSVVSYQNLGSALLKLNRLDEADATFQEALEKDNKMALAIFGRGQVAAKRRRLDLARDFYLRAAELEPDNPLFHYALSQILFRLKDPKGGQKALNRYRRAKAEVYLRESHQLLKRERWKEALAPLQKAVEVDPTFIAAMEDKAYVQMRLGDFDAAKKGYEQILKSEPALPASIKAQLNLGIIESELGNLETSESIFLDIIRKAPDFPDSYPHLAQLRERKGDLAGAEAVFDLGIQREAQWAPGYWWRGQIRQKRGNIAGAEADFRQAITLAPNISFPKNSLARLLAEERRHLDEALKLAQAAVKADPIPEHRATLALVYYSLNKMEEAQREIEKAYQDNPKHPDIQSIRSRILNLPGKTGNRE
jgi:tetratricopeptide (TPR) repeat protein